MRHEGGERPPENFSGGRSPPSCRIKSGLRQSVCIWRRRRTSFASSTKHNEFFLDFHREPTFSAPQGAQRHAARPPPVHLPRSLTCRRLDKWCNSSKGDPMGIPHRLQLDDVSMRNDAPPSSSCIPDPTPPPMANETCHTWQEPATRRPPYDTPV
jgi:hypothetical protein